MSHLTDTERDRLGQASWPHDVLILATVEEILARRTTTAALALQMANARAERWRQRTDDARRALAVEKARADAAEAELR